MLDFFKTNFLGILFFVSVIILAIAFVINWLMGNSGSFQDHSKLFWNMVSEIPFIGRGGTGQTSRFPKGESSGETECRRVAEKITGFPFPKARPDFLKNSITGANLELDCFCEELKVAIEYNGRQHYEFVPHFHSSKDAFQNTKYRDEMKKRLCDESGVELIIVPFTVPIDEIENFLRAEFGKRKL